jgi:hypothetical protein
LHGHLIVFHDQNAFLHRKDPASRGGRSCVNGAFPAEGIGTINGGKGRGDEDVDADHSRWRR